METRVRNLRRRPVQLEAMLVLPDRWRLKPAKVILTMAPGDTGSAPVQDVRL